MDTAETRSIRDRVCRDLRGDVLEIGFGTGLNLPHLPGSVRRIHTVEPLDRCQVLARDRIDACGVEVTQVAHDARSIPLPDASIDHALSTWSLCSIDDPVEAITEIRRVVRPGGTLHFVEHGEAADPKTRRRQRRWDPIWSRLSCGCHLDRPIESIITAGGLEIERLDQYATETEPAIVGWTYEGCATVP